MFKAELDNAKGFKKLVDTLSAYLDEACLEVNENGIKLVAMEEAHVLLVSLEIPKLAFEEYEADSHQIGIYLDELEEAMKCVNKNDKLILELDEEKNKLNIIFENDGIKRVFGIKVDERIKPQEIKIPEINYQNSILIKGDVLKKALKDAKKLRGNDICFETRENAFIVKSDVISVESFEVIFEEDSPAIVDLDVKQNAKSSFKLGYLFDIFKGIGKEDFVRIYLDTDTPVKIEYHLSEVGANLMFLVAPCISNL